MKTPKFLTEAIRLLGFQIGDKSPEQQFKSFAIPQNTDGASQVTAGGIYGTYVDLEGTSKNEADLITRYRDMGMQPECEMAIDNIVNDAIVQNNNDPAVTIDLENLEQPESIKTKIRESFDKITKLLNFNEDGYQIFKRWYVDGRLYYNIIIDEKSPEDGIQELRYLDPRRIRKMRAIHKLLGAGGVEMVSSIIEYFLYNERGIISIDSNTSVGQKISADSICYVHSGEIDSLKNLVLSFLHRAIKPLNQLRSMEDAHVIYRISRAAERRVFYIDVGNMPTQRAEQYIKSIIADFRNKLVFDSATGEVRDDKRFLSMQEDFFLPRREGGKGTEVTTLPAGQNLGQMEDVQYFQERLYKSLGVPISRLKGSEQSMGFSRGAEISRDEYNFSKFIERVRKRFNHLFYVLLRADLLLTGVMLEEEWDAIREQIYFEYQTDSYYAEVQEQQVWAGRLTLLSQIDPYQDKIFSRAWIKKNVLKLTDEQIQEMDKELDAEKDLVDAEAQREAGFDKDGDPFGNEPKFPPKGKN